MFRVSVIIIKKTFVPTIAKYISAFKNGSDKGIVEDRESTRSEQIKLDEVYTEDHKREKRPGGFEKLREYSWEKVTR